MYQIIYDELEKLNKEVNEGEVRSMLICGPTGCGKTFSVRNWLGNKSNYVEISCNTFPSQNREHNIFNQTGEEILNVIKDSHKIVFFDMIDCTDSKARELIKDKILQLKERGSVLLIATCLDVLQVGFEALEEEVLDLFETKVNAYM